MVKRIGDAIPIRVREWTTVVLCRARLIRALVKRIRDAICIHIG